METTKTEHDEQTHDMLLRLLTVAEMLVNRPERDGDDQTTVAEVDHASTLESPQKASRAEADV